MYRRKTRRSVDRAIFRKTANRTRKINIRGHGSQRGGTEF